MSVNETDMTYPKPAPEIWITVWVLCALLEFGNGRVSAFDCDSPLSLETAPILGIPANFRFLVEDGARELLNVGLLK